MSESVGPGGAAASGLPLAGIKVLDLSRVLAGPWATMSLADLGAEVWKIENVDGGDDTRAWSVPSYNGVSTYYLCANRGKSSIAVDIKHPKGREIIYRLAAKADVVIENFRAGTVQRLKIDYETLKAFNPGIIYCSISGYGQTGPEWDRPGYDFVVQAESGLMSITGPVDGEPQRIGVAMTDIIAGMVSVQSVLAALYQRRETGQGQYIDISLLECALNTLINVGSGYLNAGVVPRRYGNAHPTVVPYQICECSDGSFALAVGNDKQFTALCEKVVGMPDLAQDPLYKTAAARALNRESLLPKLGQSFRANTRHHWMEACLRHGVPAGEVKSVPEAFESRTVKARNVVQTLHNQHLGPVSLVRPAQGLATQRDAHYKAPPMLGEDTTTVLSAFGYAPEEVEDLIRQGVVRQYSPAAA
ncbi:MAG: CoA transferase [Mesorhizobium sp.]|uniref:CaiB/BaiF CoA transferase family protein n=2 Tax=unclassified Mesorhizobium TaxID=325217 RepID=UPI000FD49529|nr:CaiB/BaiF CoA-transferase family protein [Mesorhizobium sp.]RUY08995.1 CoA transferase [Mesorhizobium sp. M2A.F.Ca.ET.040.01.1.1]RWA79064.1 MAG: CoA transferase [Mesorhizobium sp.]TIV17011.1 MAG: CoA transferase [Mesorhizobium sp.]